MAVQLSLCLRGNALQLYHALPNNVKYNYREVVNGMIMSISSDVSKVQIRTELLAMRQEYSESVDDFYVRFVSTAQPLRTSEESSCWLASLFRSQLQLAIKQKLWHTEELSLEAIKSQASAIEAELRLISHERAVQQWQPQALANTFVPNWERYVPLESPQMASEQQQADLSVQTQYQPPWPIPTPTPGREQAQSGDRSAAVQQVTVAPRARTKSPPVQWSPTSQQSTSEFAEVTCSLGRKAPANAAQETALMRLQKSKMRPETQKMKLEYRMLRT